MKKILFILFLACSVNAQSLLSTELLRRYDGTSRNLWLMGEDGIALLVNRTILSDTALTVLYPYNSKFRSIVAQRFYSTLDNNGDSLYVTIPLNNALTALIGSLPNGSVPWFKNQKWNLLAPKADEFIKFNSTGDGLVSSPGTAGGDSSWVRVTVDTLLSKTGTQITAASAANSSMTFDITNKGLGSVSKLDFKHDATSWADIRGTASGLSFYRLGGLGLSYDGTNWDFNGKTITNATWNGAAISKTYLANTGTLSFQWVDSEVSDLITLSNITQITNRSHTNLTDIGTNTHPQIDAHIANTSNPHSVTAAQTGAVPTTRTLTMTGTADQINIVGGTQDLSANRTWTFSTPQDIATTSDVQFNSVLSNTLRSTGTTITAEPNNANSSFSLFLRSRGTGSLTSLYFYKDATSWGSIRTSATQMTFYKSGNVEGFFNGSKFDVTDYVDAGTGYYYNGTNLNFNPAPGNSLYYGTNSSGVLGYYAASVDDSSWASISTDRVNSLTNNSYLQFNLGTRSSFNAAANSSYRLDLDAKGLGSLSSLYLTKDGTEWGSIRASANTLTLYRAGSVKLTLRATETDIEEIIDARGGLKNDGGVLTISDDALITGATEIQGNISNSTGSVTVADKLLVTGVGEIQGDFVMASPNVPTSATSLGVAGTIAWDSNYIYVCIATNTWKRVAIATW